MTVTYILWNCRKLKYILLGDVDPIRIYRLITSVAIKFSDFINSVTHGEENTAVKK